MLVLVLAEHNVLAGQSYVCRTQDLWCGGTLDLCLGLENSRLEGIEDGKIGKSLANA